MNSRDYLYLEGLSDLWRFKLEFLKKIIWMFFLLLLSCEETNVTEDIPDDVSFSGVLDNGIQEFKTKNYNRSKLIFRGLLNEENCPDSIKQKSFVGEGYSLLRENKLDSAAFVFDRGIDNNYTGIAKYDLLLGKAFLDTWHFSEYRKGRESAENVINHYSSYRLFLDEEINHLDVRLLFAQSAYFQKDYYWSLAIIKTLGMLENTEVSDIKITEKLLVALNALGTQIK